MEIATAFVAIRPQADGGFEGEVGSMVSGIPDAEVPIIADTGEAEAAIEGISDDQLSLFVDADTADAQAEIDSIEGGETEIKVEADTEEAEQKVEALSDSTSKLEDVAQGAIGGMGGLSGAAGGAASVLGESAVAGGAAAIGLFKFAEAGIEAESSAQRFNLVTGPMADGLRDIDVGGLTGDLGDLALGIGSSDEGIINATSSWVTFAQSTGAADDEIVSSSNNINALALRVAALNPEMGDAGDIALRLQGALARGGRATRQYGIDLQSAAIQQRALSDTGKTNVADLTDFEKAAAGAEIVTERLGNTLGTSYAEGAENAALKTERLEESFGEGAESIGGLMLPAVEDLTEGLTQLSDGAQDLDPGTFLAGLWDVTAFGQIQNGLGHIWDAIQGTGTVAGEAAPNIRFSADASRLLGIDANQAADAIDALAQSIDDYLAGLFDVPSAQREARQSISELTEAVSTGTWDDQAVAMEGVVTKTAELIGAQQTQHATQGELNATIYAQVAALAAERDQGHVTGAMFDTLAAAIAGVPHESVTPVSAPGAETARGQADDVNTSVRSIPTNWPINITAQVNRAGLDRMLADLGQLQNSRYYANVVINQAQAAESFGIDRPESTAAPVAITPITQIFLDGEMISNNGAEHDRRFDIALGFEQP